MTKPYTLVIDDADCHLSTRFAEANDCTVRSIAIVTSLSYDHVFDVLAEAGRKPNRGFESDQWLKKRRGRVLGGRFKAVNVKGLVPDTFAHRYPIGRYLVETADHVYSVLDGVAHDLGRVKKQFLTGAWVWTPKP